MKLNLTFPQCRSLVRAIVRLDSASKQELGRRFDHHLGFIPGPRGPDDGIDGYLPITGGAMIHFQSKLSSVELDKDDARKYYADIKFHNASSSVMLVGVGYKHTFCQRLFGSPDISNVKVHLLTLNDLFGETKAYWDTLDDIPEVQHLLEIEWEQYGR